MYSLCVAVEVPLVRPEEALSRGRLVASSLNIYYNYLGLPYNIKYKNTPRVLNL